MAYGTLNLSPQDLNNFTAREFFNKQLGHFEFAEMQEQQNWERTRWLAAIVVNPHTKKRIKPKDLCVFEWESAGRVNEIQTKSDRERLEQEGVFMDKVWKKKGVVKNKK